MADYLVIAVYLLRILYPYRPFLDDHIQYNVYSLHSEPIRTIFTDAGTFTTRPAANFLDIALYSHFGDVLYIPYIFFVLLYLAFVLMLRNVMSKIHIDTGRIFTVIALLCPLNIEGTVWLSASTRIVAGLFLGTFCARFLLSDGSLPNMIVFWILNLISFLFYEQAVVYTLLLIFLISYYRRHIFPVAIALLNASAVAVFYFAFRDYGVFSHRMSSVSLPDIGYFLSNLNDCLGSSFFTLVQSCILFALPFGIITGLYVAKGMQPCVFSVGKLLFGIAVAVFSFAPLTVMGEYNIPFRCLAVPLIGAALVADCITPKRISQAVAVILVTVFVSSSFAEFRTLDISTAIDEKLVSVIADVVTANKGKTIAIHGAVAYYDDKPSNHAEHIAAITSSDWAITGALRAKLKNPRLPMINLETTGDVNIYMSHDGTNIDMVE